MADDFTVMLMFPDEYRDFIAEIQFGNQYVCTITQELGPESFAVEFAKMKPQLPLDQFLEAIELAKKRLIEFREPVD